ncbi:Fungal-specific transcription factor domain-containing protein [Madurella fahalii]|uniref:Fungal-specific transcription factor domain-containing protein n=1 Tax=Madurella fahalii TaxID=1157608 RepID=A0ABQ0GPB4_9PEZI
MKNRQKSRSGCRTCKLKRLRCDETKPGCRNCTQKGLECPGYQQRLQWSTKHERPTTINASGPANFSQLVTAASESIAKPTSTAAGPTHGGTKTAVASLAPASQLLAPAAISPSSSSSTLSPPPEDAVASAGTSVALVPLVHESRPVVPVSTRQATELPMFQPVVDIPTFLIEHWFKSVCSSWSALDSQANPYRRLTSSLWNTSTPVFYALQAISAASLVERLPHVMKDTARSAPRKATEAIQQELVAFFDGRRPGFPSDLLLSLFCMSSSMCWMEARQLGPQYVRQARAVLKSLGRCALDVQTQELLGFFNGCLIYEEMLRSVVSDEEIDFENMLSWPEPPSQRPLVPVIPHAWTGVSPDVLRLFGKAMALCRRSRTRWRHNGGTSYRILQGAMRDIEEATKVEEALLSFDVPQLPESTETPQGVNRARDLHYITEAYRLSSLLQLYVTFPDLNAKRVPTLKDADGATVWNVCVSPLALHLTNVLKRIPEGSLRCIQPLICLCAGSGLRYDAKVPLGRGHRSYLLSTEPDAPAPSTSGVVNIDSPYVNHSVSEHAIKTSQARQFIMERLDQHELSLPPKPIGVAKQLLRAVWSAYDEEIGLDRRTHWLDVMSYTGLHSLFG